MESSLIYSEKNIQEIMKERRNGRQECGSEKVVTEKDEEEGDSNVTYSKCGVVKSTFKSHGIKR